MQKAKVHMEKLLFAMLYKVAVATGFILKPSRSCNGTTQGAEFELPELSKDVCTGWRVHCRGKAAHRTCRAGESPQWVALDLLGNPVMPQAPQSTQLSKDCSV